MMVESILILLGSRASFHIHEGCDLPELAQLRLALSSRMNVAHNNKTPQFLYNNQPPLFFVSPMALHVGIVTPVSSFICNAT